MIYILMAFVAVLAAICAVLIYKIREDRIKYENIYKNKDLRIEELIKHNGQLQTERHSTQENYDAIRADKIRLEADNAHKDRYICDLLQKIKALESDKEALRMEYQHQRDDNAKFKAQSDEKQKRIDELSNDIKESKEQHKNMFENVKKELEKYIKLQDENVFHKVGMMINEDSKKILDNVFKPLQEQMEKYSKNLLQNEAHLKGHIENVFKYSQTMQQTSENLSKILKGDKKVRGNFGEIQLENVLQNSGLIEGINYELQAHFKEENKGYIPDAVVFVDGAESDKERRCIVIDSKFPLPNDLALDSVAEVDREIAKEIADNLKNRVDELARKPYKHFNPHTYDFALLFLPYNNILDLALSADANIYQYAYNKKIYLVTPHTLLMALKTIHISWIHNQRDKNIAEAYKELNGIYDKFAGALETFEQIKNISKRLNENVIKLEGQLQNGKGSVSNRFESLKKFGVTPKKELPQ